MRRPRDWFRQAELDLGAARDARRLDHHEWACFAAQQAAEKAVKALHESVGTEAWGHSVAELLRGLGDIPAELLDAARALDKHYIPARYPNSPPDRGSRRPLHGSRGRSRPHGRRGGHRICPTSSFIGLIAIGS